MRQEEDRGGEGEDGEEPVRMRDAAEGIRSIHSHRAEWTAEGHGRSGSRGAAERTEQLGGHVRAEARTGVTERARARDYRGP